MSKQKDLHNGSGKTKSKVELNEKIFDGEINYPLLRQAVLMYESRKRQGNASTKTRSDTSGGGRKPWAQKGTGRARAGSIRSPLWIGGGITFGPKPRDFSYKMPKKMKKIALKSGLNAKSADNEIKIIDELKIDKPKTKLIFSILSKLKVIDNTILLVVNDIDENLKLACRNIENLTLKQVFDINCYDVLKNKNLVITKSALSELTKYLKY